MWVAVAVWVAMATCVSGQARDQHQFLVKPQQVSGEHQSDDTRERPSGIQNSIGDVVKSIGRGGNGSESSDGGGSGGNGGVSSNSRYEGGTAGGGRKFSVLNRQYGGGRRQYAGRGLRQGGRQQGGGRRHYGAVSGGDGGDERDSVVSQDSEIPQLQSDTIILMLQRLSDRLSGIEVLQRQQDERIGTINYRLTKIELQAEERKSIISDLSNSLRHRMETTDAGLDQVNSQLDDIKNSILGLGQQYNEIKANVAGLHTEQGDRGSEVNGLKLQAMTSTVQGLRTATEVIKDDMQQLTHNMSALNSISKNLTHLTEKMVTKQYLYQNLNEIKSKDSAMSLLAQMMMVKPPTSRRSSSRKEPEDCWQLMRQGKNKSGVYNIQPRFSLTPFFVYCDMETDGGGWTVIHRREDGTVDFLREWADYKYGFGNVAGEHWLGNEKIHLLTNQRVSKLRVDLADFDQQDGHAIYSAFAIGSELEGYSLKILGEYMGDAGDSLRYHVGRRFSTIDVDNDAWPDRSCARDHMGAWWYRACETSNLNGRYLHGPIPAEHQYTGLYWYDFRGPNYSLWRSRMMVRRGGKVDRPVFKDLASSHNKTDTSGVTPATHEETVTTPPTDSFDPNRDPYVTFEYPNF